MGTSLMMHDNREAEVVAAAAGLIEVDRRVVVVRVATTADIDIAGEVRLA